MEVKLNHIYEGDCLETLKTFPDKCVDMCVTSPPYYALRDYGCEGQIGLEETPEAYISKLADVFDEVKRVLKDDGTLWVNIGDSYWGGDGEMPPSMSTAEIFKKALRVLIVEKACRI